MVANIGSNLLKTPGRNERRDRIGHGPQPVHGQTGSQSGHVGFRNAAIEKTVLVLVLESVEKTVADIAGEHDNAMVLVAKLGQFVGESVSHESPNSLRARATSSAVGAR